MQRTPRLIDEPVFILHEGDTCIKAACPSHANPHLAHLAVYIVTRKSGKVETYTVDQRDVPQKGHVNGTA